MSRVYRRKDEKWFLDCVPQRRREKVRVAVIVCFLILFAVARSLLK